MRKKRLLAILATGERSRGELADPTQEAQVAVATLQASARGGRMFWHEYNIYSKTYTEGSDPF